MKKIISLILFIFSFLETINCQFEVFGYLSSITLQVMSNCKSRGETGVKQFSDCNQASNYTNDQICCYIYGINADGTSYRGCIAMNMTMFGNKTLSYDSETISGTLICDANYNFSNYFKNCMIFYLYLFVVIIIF